LRRRGVVAVVGDAALRRRLERPDERLELVAERLPLCAIALDVAAEALELFERGLRVESGTRLRFLFHMCS